MPRRTAIATGLLFPEGPAAETGTGGLWAFDLDSPERIGRHAFPSPNGGRFIAGLPGFQRFGSFALEASGNICVALLIVTLGGTGQLVAFDWPRPGLRLANQRAAV